jgi:polar amino acid transport system permease protein
MFQLDFATVLSPEFRSWLIGGFVLSLQLTFVTLLLAFPLGTAIALARLSSIAPLRWIGFIMVEGVRSVPLLVHLLFWYFGATTLLSEDTRAWLYEHNAESVCAVIALTLYTAAYIAEDVRAGIRAVPKTQTEAARALGLGALQTLRQIVLPQAIRIAVPPLISQTVTLWKNTSIATVIGTAELMYQAQRVETATFRGVETFAVVTLAYLTVSLTITGLAAWYQQRFPARVA